MGDYNFLLWLLISASAHPFLIIFGYTSQTIPLLADSVYLTSGTIIDD